MAVENIAYLNGIGPRENWFIEGMTVEEKKAVFEVLEKHLFVQTHAEMSGQLSPIVLAELDHARNVYKQLVSDLHIRYGSRDSWWLNVGVPNAVDPELLSEWANQKPESPFSKRAKFYYNKILAKQTS